MRTWSWWLAPTAWLLAWTWSQAADAPTVPLSEGGRFTERDGQALYQAICQGCHMADGRGARGAGTYPALAANPRLAVAAYPALMVLRGRRDMPAFGGMLSDDQVAEVTRYVRTHLGNDYVDPYTPSDVEALRRTP